MRSTPAVEQMLAGIEQEHDGAAATASVQAQREGETD
jgi:hypothetical protein